MNNRWCHKCIAEVGSDRVVSCESFEAASSGGFLEKIYSLEVKRALSLSPCLGRLLDPFFFFVLFLVKLH